MIAAIRAARPSRAPRFPDRMSRCGRSAAWSAWRIGASLARRRSAGLSRPVVRIQGARVRADLHTPLGLSLYRYGFCSPEVRLLPQLLLPGDIFIDGGANIGVFSLIGALAVGPTGRVLACEPAPGTMALLRANAGENQLASLELHEVALSDCPGRARFTVFDAGSGLASFAPEHAAGRQVDVSVTTLDALTEGLDSPVSVVKLDIEGAEAKALRGARALIARHAPIFLMEIEPEHLARQDSSIRDIRAVLEPEGYAAYAITPAARLARLTGDWQPPDAQAPNVVLAPPSHTARLSGIVASADPPGGALSTG